MTEVEDRDLIKWLRSEAQFWRCANPVAKRGESLDEAECLTKSKQLDAVADKLNSLQSKVLIDIETAESLERRLVYLTSTRFTEDYQAIRDTSPIIITFPIIHNDLESLSTAIQSTKSNNG